MKTIATLFGGFGGVDVGAMAARLEPAWSVEYDAAIAEVAAANFAHPVHVANLLDCDPRRFDAVDILHASPPCPNFSVAKAGGAETALDLALARKVAEFVTVLRPQVFTLENVYAYRLSRSWHVIEDALNRAGYWLHADHVNAADYGVPQTRKRLVVRAIRGGFVPYLPEAVPWVGWYAAIEDLLPTLPESQFAPWQLARLPEVLQTVMVGGANRSKSFLEFAKENRPNIPGRRLGDQPSMTIAATSSSDMRAFLMQVQGEPTFTVTTDYRQSHMPRALLIGGGNASRELSIRDGDRPSITVTTGGTKEPMRAYLVNESSTMEVRTAEEPSAVQVASSRNIAQRAALPGRVVAMTPRALARFQSFPDSYRLPDSARLAAKGIGNAVPPLLYQSIITPLLETL